jgi:PBSX family phage terminase large subunit
MSWPVGVRRPGAFGRAAPDPGKPLAHEYTPRGTAREVFARRGPEVLVSGPAGTGKSRACLEKLHAMCLVNPGMRALICRKTLASLGSTALVTYREHVAAEALLAGHVVFYGGSPQESPQYRYGNGSVVVVGGMDRSSRIMSAEYDLIYVQEATELTEEDWEAITTRLRNGVVSFQQVIADANPSTPTHWLKARCDRGVTELLNATHKENPRLYDAKGTLTEVGKSYLGKLQNLTGVRKSRLLDGLWVAAEGIIYDEFQPSIHVIPQAPIPDSWTRVWSVDFGFTNPFVLQCWAVDPEGRLVLYRELYRTRRRVDQHAETILDVVAPRDASGQRSWTEPKPTAVVCDHDAAGRSTFTAVTGLNTKTANKKVIEGIQAVQRRLRPGPDGGPRLMVMAGARLDRDGELAEAKRPTSTEEEFPGYIWDVGAGLQPKEQPLKDNDHGMDAVRYLVMHWDHRQSSRLRYV